MMRTIHEVQRDFALSSVLRNEIIWDTLAPHQDAVLRQKILELMPDTGKNDEELDKMRKYLFENIWAQRKYTNGTLLCSIIYVMVTEEKNSDLALMSTDFSCHLVFRTRKCTNAMNSAGCCMIFVDQHSRVYQNWQDFVKNNVLPPGTMVAPLMGIYKVDDNECVILECNQTPAGRKTSKILSKTDKIAVVGSLVATAPFAAAIALPVAAPVMATATAVALTTTAYSTFRSVMHLDDRRKHGQSNALTNRAARNSWLGIATGVVGIGASGATQALSTAAIAGREINLATKMVVNGINVTSILLSGTGVCAGIHEMYLKANNDETPTTMDVLQLASSLLVFTHSLNNLRIVSKATSTANGNGNSIRNEIVRQIRIALTRTRNHFNMSNSRRSIRNGNFVDNADIIRPFNDIPITETIVSGANSVISTVNTGSGTAGSNNGLMQNFTNTITPLVIERISAGITEDMIYNLAHEYGNAIIDHINDGNSMLDVMNLMATTLADKVYQFILNLANTYIKDYLKNFSVADNMISTEIILYRIYQIVMANYPNLRVELLQEKMKSILTEVDNYFQSLRSVNNTNRNNEHVCELCKGRYVITDLSSM